MRVLLVVVDALLCVLTLLLHVVLLSSNACVVGRCGRTAVRPCALVVAGHVVEQSCVHGLVGWGRTAVRPCPSLIAHPSPLTPHPSYLTPHELQSQTQNH
jgi:hypothetical protein